MFINKDYQMSKPDGDNAYRWIQARKQDPCWNDGFLMKQEDVDNLKSQKYPV